MVLPDSHEIPRVPCYLGKRKTSDRHTPTGVSPSTLRLSNRFNFIHQFITRRPVNSQTTTHPTTPAPQHLSAITRHRFSLIHFRSPLLTESLLFSLPTGTEMFHFPAFPPTTLYIQAEVTGHNSGIKVTPFGNPRIKTRLPTPLGLSQVTTSFIGSWCQGIHRSHLVACQNTTTKSTKMLASTIKFSKHTPPKTPRNKNRETPRNHRETAATQETTDPSKPNSAPPQTWYKPTFHPETKT